MILHKYLYEILNASLYKENSNKERIKLYPHTGMGEAVYAPSVGNKCDTSWAILKCDEELVKYYKWFLSKKGVKVDSLMWGSHISVVRGGVWDKILPEYENIWGYNEGTKIEFRYGDLVTNGTHWWLEVQSKQLEDMREKLGLSPHPGFGFHVTIGKISVFK